MDGINTSEFDKKITALNGLYKQLPSRAATEAVNFSKERFLKQNWEGDSTQPWAKRKDKGKKSRGRGILVRSGRLKRSIRKIRVTETIAIVGTDVPYARAHNEGATKEVSVRSHSRRSRKGKASKVKAFKRHMSLPKRQFLGESIALTRRIERAFLNEFNRVLNA